MIPSFLFNRPNALLGSTGPQEEAVRRYVQDRRCACSLILYTQDVYQQSSPARGIDPKRLEQHLDRVLAEIPDWWDLADDWPLQVLLDDEVLRWREILDPKTRTPASIARDAVRVGEAVHAIKMDLTERKLPYPVEVGVYGRPYRYKDADDDHAFDGSTCVGIVGADFVCPACYQLRDEREADYARRFDCLAHASVACRTVINRDKPQTVPANIVWSPLKEHRIDPLTKAYTPVWSMAPHLSLDGRFRIGREVLPTELETLFVWMGPRWQGTVDEPGWIKSGWPSDPAKSLQYEALIVDDIVRSMTSPNP